MSSEVEIFSPSRGIFKLSVNGQTYMVWNNDKVKLDLREPTKSSTFWINDTSERFKLGVKVGKQNRAMQVWFNGERQLMPDHQIVQLEFKNEVPND